jgi:ATPase domain predominantly from Archaea
MIPETVNPYIAGNPIKGTEMFFGREDVFAYVRETLTGLQRDHPIVLYGERRSGKTSVLYQMERRIDARYLCVFIDLHGLALTSFGQFLWETAQLIRRRLREQGIDVSAVSREAFEANPQDTFNGFVTNVEPALGGRRLLLMFDEAVRLHEQVDAGKLDTVVFEYLRHLMQHYDWLNFIFSLGSSLEEMDKKSAFLFSVTFYKRISFLNETAARALVTEPVKRLYSVDEDAVDRVLDITSGHPYYTQLVCHCLFSHWHEKQGATMHASDVDAVLAHAIEAGSANLKYVWEDSTAGEKAVLAGLAAATDGTSRGIAMDAVTGTWAEHGVTIPQAEIAKATQSLSAREVVVREEDSYSFRVDLQRLWLDRHRKLDWVKEEIAGDLEVWQQRNTRARKPEMTEPLQKSVRSTLPPPRRRRRKGLSPSGVAVGAAASESAHRGRAIWSSLFEHALPRIAAIIGVVAGLVGISFVLFPSLRPESPPPVISAQLSHLSATPNVTYGAYLRQVGRSTAGIGANKLLRWGFIIEGRLRAQGLRGKRLAIWSSLVDANSGRTSAETGFPIIMTPRAQDESEVIAQWVQATGSAMCYATMRVEDGQRVLDQARGPSAQNC